MGSIGVRRAAVLSLVAGIVGAGVLAGTPGVGMSRAAMAAAPRPRSAAPERLAGADRYATAVAIAERVGGGSLGGLTGLVIVSGEHLGDGLAAAGLAGHLDACATADEVSCGRTAVLLTPTAHLASVTAEAITASGVAPADVVVLGGETAVSADVHRDVAIAAGWSGAGANPVVRIAGADRYRTAAAVVQFAVDRAAARGTPLRPSFRTVMLVSGEQSADAIAAGSLAYRAGHFVLLTRGDELPEATVEAMRHLGAVCATVVGGPRAVSDGVLSSIETVFEPDAAGCVVDRLAGTDRYATAVAVADSYVRSFGAVAGALVAAGDGFPDALIAAPLAAQRMPIVLVRRSGLPEATTGWLAAQARSLRSLVVLGGADAVAPPVAGEVVAAATPPPLPPPPPAPVVLNATPAFDWAVAAGSSTAWDTAFAVAMLADGSAIVTGQFEGTVTLAAAPPIVLTSAGGVDIFVAKIDSYGQWVWGTSAGGTSHDGGFAVVALADGSAIVAGAAGAATFSAATPITINPMSGDRDAFVAKVNADGTWAWATSAGSGLDDRATGVAAFADGSAIVTGTFQGATATFSGATPATLTNVRLTQSNDAFVAKVGADGSWIWARSLGTDGTDSAASVAVFADGTSVVAGAIEGSTVTVSGSTPVVVARPAPMAGYDGYVAKFGPDGSLTWLRFVGGPGYEMPDGVDAFDDGSAVVVGNFTSSTVTFSGATPITVANTSLNGNPDGFAAKITSDGNWVWVAPIEGDDSDYPASVATRIDGSVVVVGAFDGTVRLGTHTLHSPAPGDWDIYVGVLGADGAWASATSAGGVGGGAWDSANDVEAASDGSIVVVGEFSAGSPANFGSTVLTTSDPANSDGDFFVARLR